jgi:deferrochelatase/peroxidase EfeB
VTDGTGRLSRRRLLVLAGGAVGAAAAGGAIATIDDGRTAVTETVDFHGEHQAGITTPQQAHLRFAAFDLTTASRENVGRLMRRWTAAAALMAGGHALGRIESNRWAPPIDTGEADGLPASRLTVTLGLGPTFFDRLGLESQRPEQLAPLPHFPGDALIRDHSNGDLCVLVSADDPQIAYHAQRNLTRIGLGAVALRWTQSGFLALPGQGRTPRNLMGFKDGTANLDASDTALMESNVWAAAGDGQTWMAGGSYLVSRRVRIRIEAWDRTPIGEQESIFGRRKGNGAPFGGSQEHDRVVDSKLPRDAHIRLANPRSGASSERQRILRRGYNFDDGMAPGLTQSDAGLFFLAFQRDPHAQFVPIQQRLASSDRLNEYIQHTSSGLWAVPPGTRGGYLAESLLT